MFFFNVRAYGILITPEREVLISDERVGSVKFTKFPGGGLERGEGLIDALKREYIEECNLAIECIQHIYTTDFYEKSSFNESQILSVYYQIALANSGQLRQLLKITTEGYSHSEVDREKEERFRLVPIDQISEDTFTFKTDKVAWRTFVASLNAS